jgi:thioredoxin 2
MREVAEADLEIALRDAPGLVVLDFYTADCRPCRAMEPHLRELEAQEGVPVLRVDAAAAPELCRRHDVRGVPTLLLVRSGEVVARRSGFALLRELREWVRAAGG